MAESLRKSSSDGRDYSEKQILRSCIDESNEIPKTAVDAYILDFVSLEQLLAEHI